MTDAGFFRGTSADQDNRFADKQKKLLKELNFSPILNTKLNMMKIDLDSLKPWIEEKIKEILEKDDEILSDSIYEHLAGKEPDGKTLLLLLTGFVEEDNKASKFMEELWTKLIDTQQNSNGISPKANATSSPGNGVPEEKSQDPTHNNPSKTGSVDFTKESESADKNEEVDDPASERKSRSRSRTPQPQKPVSKSHSRSGSRSPRHSRSVSKSGSKSPSKSRSRSKSGSQSHSRSRSGSRRRSSTRSKSRSRSSSKSPHYRTGRFRRSRSRSGSYRSPRGRRGYIPRGSYRGFNYQDRRRGGPIGPPRGRRMVSPPWSRRRSPPSYRRRRSPSRSPRRRSRSPLYRGRRSRSRSPPYGHMMGRRSPRPHGFASGPPMGQMSGRHLPPHDIHRPVMPPRSPRGPAVDYSRGYGDSAIMPGHSPGHLMPRSHDLPPAHSLGMPRPSGSGAYSPRSPSSDRRRHKKEKKHRKHKKSKKRHSSSSSPERRKKHKKHKKSKKHKS